MITGPEAVVIAAALALVQGLVGIWLGARIKGTTSAVNSMEKQINSNMERQIKQAINEALAKERLRVNEAEARSPPEGG